jgi:hypothetical protein
MAALVVISSMRPILLIVVLALSGCPSKSAEEPEPEAITQQFADRGAIVHQHDNANVAWTIDESGKVRAALRARDGKAITNDVKGELSWKDSDGKSQTAKLTHNPKTGLLEADGVPLPEGELSYSLNVNGAPVTGILPVPRRAADAPTAEPAPPVASAAPPTPPPPASPPASPPAASSVPSKSGRKTEDSGRFPRR